jgi:hypothetical protein
VETERPVSGCGSWRTIGWTAHAVLGLLLLIGCQTSSGDVKVDAQARFSELWKIYTHCRTNDDAEGLLMDAIQLNKAAQIPPPALPKLLKPVQRFVSASPVRVAADPRAMAAACSLRAGQAALAMGWNELAVELYKSIPLYAAGDDYDYYVRQAQLGLVEARQHQKPIRVVPLFSHLPSIQPPGDHSAQSAR